MSSRVRLYYFRYIFHSISACLWRQHNVSIIRLMIACQLHASNYTQNISCKAGCRKFKLSTECLTQLSTIRTKTCHSCILQSCNRFPYFKTDLIIYNLFTNCGIIRVTTGLVTLILIVITIIMQIIVEVTLTILIIIITIINWIDMYKTDVLKNRYLKNYENF